MVPAASDGKKKTAAEGSAEACWSTVVKLQCNLASLLEDCTAVMEASKRLRKGGKPMHPRNPASAQRWGPRSWERKRAGFPGTVVGPPKENVAT